MAENRILNRIPAPEGWSADGPLLFILETEIHGTEGMQCMASDQRPATRRCGCKVPLACFLSGQPSSWIGLLGFCSKGCDVLLSLPCRCRVRVGRETKAVRGKQLRCDKAS